MGQDPSDIRAEIEETRARVGDQVDALSYKTDVPARVGDYVDEKKQAVKDKVTGVKDAVTGTASKRDAERRARWAASRTPRSATRSVSPSARPRIGFVAGLLIPSTRVENEHMGEMSDRVVDAAKETAATRSSAASRSPRRLPRPLRRAAGSRGRNWPRTCRERVQQSTSGPSTTGQAS